ncbi:MAG: Hint domain-containing protein [Sulfitobacter sp.]
MPTVNTGLGGPTGHGEFNFLASTPDAGNDDDGSIAVDVTSVFGAGGIDFFGTSYTDIYINTNGLITFTGPDTTYNGSSLASYPEPALAPFWTDHDLTGGNPTGSNNIYWDLDTVNNTVTITWFGVEPYQGGGTNTFQVVLSSLGGGTFGVEYIYENIGFTNGFGAQAQAGVTDGAGNDFILPGSGNASELADYDTDNLDPDSPDGTWDLFINNGTVVCFLEGTLIETQNGPRPVQWLRKGDMIATADNGFQPLKAALNSRFVACDRTLPIQIKAHCLDNDQDLFVSPQHRILIANSMCELFFGEPEVFVAAKHLIGLPGIHATKVPKKISYYHLLLDRHEIIYSNGQPTESFFVGDMALLTLAKTQKLMEREISQSNAKIEIARPTLKSYEARLLVSAMSKTGIPDQPRLNIRASGA